MNCNASFLSCIFVRKNKKAAMKRLRMIGISVISALCAMVFLTCIDNNHPTLPIPDLPESPIVILYDNDVHCEVDGYAKRVAMKWWPTMKPECSCKSVA